MPNRTAGDKGGAVRGRPARRTLAERHDAVLQVLMGKAGLDQVDVRMGVHPATIEQWRDQALAGMSEALLRGDAPRARTQAQGQPAHRVSRRATPWPSKPSTSRWRRGLRGPREGAGPRSGTSPSGQCGGDEPIIHQASPPSAGKATVKQCCEVLWMPDSTFDVSQSPLPTPAPRAIREQPRGIRGRGLLAALCALAKTHPPTDAARTRDRARVQPPLGDRPDHSLDARR